MTKPTRRRKRGRRAASALPNGPQRRAGRRGKPVLLRVILGTCVLGLIAAGSFWWGSGQSQESADRTVVPRKELPSPNSPAGDFTGAAAGGQLTAAELLKRYCTLVYEQTRSLEQTAKRLELDRRTVRSKLGLAPAKN